MTAPATIAAVCLAALPALAVAAADPGAAPPPVACPEGAAESRVYAFSLGGNRAGFETACRMPDGAREYVHAFNDRGRGPSVRARIVLDARGVPVSLVVDGHDYLKNAVAERFGLEDGRATWQNKAEAGSREVARPAFYLSQSGVPSEIGLLARALLAAPEHRIELLPSGEARLEKLVERRVSVGGEARALTLYVISGLEFQPFALWLDEGRELFALVNAWSQMVPEGWEAVTAELLEAQEAELEALRHAQAARLARAPGVPIVIEHARLFDAEAAAMRDGMTVVIVGETIRAVHPDGAAPLPEGAERVDAAGRALVPGLWDMHSHPEPADGLLHLAGGVTAVRDLAAEPSKVERLAGWASGETLGPRVVFGGIVDGPGPFQGPTSVLAGTEAEARAAVRNMAAAGFRLVKVYSSIKPELVPAIADEAHRLGLRVAGHIPAFMTAEQAVRAGYDEIQHINMVVLNFLFDRVQDTRTPARLTAVAEHAAELDPASPRVRAFIDLLLERHVTVDPTLQIFEHLLVDRPGEVGRAWAAVAPRLPPSVQRTLKDGGLPVPEGQDARYRDSFRALLALVRALYEAGVPVVAGTDAIGGFAIVRELELYVEAGLPPAKVLQMATLGAARAAGEDERLGSIAPGKLADLVLVEGDPAADPAALRNLRLVIRNGVPLDPEAIWRELGIAPLPVSPAG